MILFGDGSIRRCVAHKPGHQVERGASQEDEPVLSLAL